MPLARRWDAIFFCSGAAALVYQVVWMRLLVRLLGSDAEGVACVLTVTMLGLGLGARLAADRTARARHPASLYAWLGVAMAAWASLSPLLLRPLEPLDSLAGRWLLATAVLLPPTLVMGATFPLMGRLVLSGPDSGPGVGGFYGANTLGAAAGALLAPFALMPALGLTGALWAGALLDLIAAAAARVTPPAGEGPPGERAAPAPDPGRTTGARPSAAPRGAVLAAALLLGCTGLALEVVWTRLLVSVTGASVYAFALVLAVFLTGIGLGGRQARSVARGAAGARVLARCGLWIPALAFAGALLLRRQLGEPDLFASLGNRLPAGAGTWKLWLSHALFAGLALFPPAVALGLALPAAAAALGQGRSAGERERDLGRLYASNTAGAALGSLAAALVLLPACGLRVAFFAALVPAFAAGLAVRAVPFSRAAVAAAVALALGAWLAPRALPPNREVLAFEVGRVSTAAVEEDPDGVRSLRVDGKVVASTAAVDLRLQRLLGHVPALLHGDVEEALVIGLGTGMTAGALLEHPSVASVDVVELSSAVVAAAAHFAPWNGSLLDDPRVGVRLADGRHALATSARRWDLVTADPIHPWTRGSSDLYALDHFGEIAAHLAPGGVASQWLPLYQLSHEDVRTVVATWCAAFAHTSAWLTAYDLALVGSNAPLPALGEFAARPLPPAVARSLAAVGVHSAAELAALRVADDAALRAFAGAASPMTADRPRLEFSAPKSYLGGYAEEALAWAARDAALADLPVAARPAAERARDALRRFLDELPSGARRAAARYGERLLGADPPSGEAP